jgi:hypothetical protein
MLEVRVAVGRDESRDQSQSLLEIRRDFVRGRRDWFAASAKKARQVKSTYGVSAAFELRYIRFGLSRALPMLSLPNGEG